jgi:hypothetical protein
MKKLAVVLGSIVTAVAATAIAQDNSDRNYPYDPDRVAREQAREVWRNNYGSDEYRARDERWRDDRGARVTARECWNPRARHFENVREGEYQDDLDYSRCRVIVDGYSSRGRWR